MRVAKPWMQGFAESPQALQFNVQGNAADYRITGLEARSCLMLKASKSI